MSKRKIIKGRKEMENPLQKYASVPIGELGYGRQEIPAALSASTAPPTELEHIDNSLRARIIRLEAYNQQLSHLLDRMIGPRPATSGKTGAGSEANPSGRIYTIKHSCEVLDERLAELQQMLEILNRLV